MSVRSGGVTISVRRGRGGVIFKKLDPWQILWYRCGFSYELVQLDY